MKKLLFIFSIFLTMAACQQSQHAARQQLVTEISSLEAKLLEVKDASKDQESALQLVEKSMQFAAQFPQDSLTPELLFKAADVARGAGEYGKAVQLWGQVWRQHADYPKASMALFLQGFTFDSDLGDAKMATQYYKQFLTQYPNDPLAEQVVQLLAVVNERPEDLVKKFEGQ